MRLLYCRDPKIFRISLLSRLSKLLECIITKQNYSSPLRSPAASIWLRHTVSTIVHKIKDL